MIQVEDGLSCLKYSRAVQKSTPAVKKTRGMQTTPKASDTHRFNIHDNEKLIFVKE